MNELFNLFDIDLDNVIKNLENIKNSAVKKYNDFMDGVKRYDLNTEEGYDSFIRDSAELRKELESSDSFFSRSAISLLDKIVEFTVKEHAEKQKKNVKQELVDREVNRTLNENKRYVKPECECHCEDEVKEEEDTIVWPSSKLTERQKRNIWRYVDRYMDEFVVPHLYNPDEDVTENMSHGLFEFAAWLLNAEEN